MILLVSRYYERRKPYELVIAIIIITKKAKEVKKDNCINTRDDDERGNQPNPLLHLQDS
jgi:hypothetical protein